MISNSVLLKMQHSAFLSELLTPTSVDKKVKKILQASIQKLWKVVVKAFQFFSEIVFIMELEISIHNGVRNKYS